MHLQPIFAQYRCVGGHVAEELFSRGLCLPSGSSMTLVELERVVEPIIAAHNEAMRV
jgi:pyridoxal phosphate-dependent aminotransferase EpsN